MNRFTNPPTFIGGKNPTLMFEIQSSLELCTNPLSIVFHHYRYQLCETSFSAKINKKGSITAFYLQYFLLTNLFPLLQLLFGETSLWKQACHTFNALFLVSPETSVNNLQLELQRRLRPVGLMA